MRSARNLHGERGGLRRRETEATRSASMFESFSSGSDAMSYNFAPAQQGEHLVLGRTLPRRGRAWRMWSSA